LAAGAFKRVVPRTLSGWTATSSIAAAFAYRIKEAGMGDTTVIKVDSSHSPKGPDGQVYLATGKHIAMRMWRDVAPGSDQAPVRREYDCAGYAISGRAELHTEGQVILLNPGDSWIVPRGAEHSYKILEAFTAVEATTPPAAVHGRDEPG